MRDSKWCHSENAETESVPKEDEYDTTQVELIGPTEGKPVGTFANDIIDLTSTPKKLQFNLITRNAAYPRDN